MKIVDIDLYDELQDLIKIKPDGKDTCEGVHDRWSINFLAPQKCVLIKNQASSACVIINAQAYPFVTDALLEQNGGIWK